jgi:2-iminobutanoate/2-iminopropanoate deaminase
VVKVTIWLTDAADFGGFNAAYSEFFGEHRPARSTVRSDLMLPGAKVEIEAVAAY